MAVEDLRRVYWRLALLTLLPLCVLTWLGVRMLAGDRDAERQRHADRLRPGGRPRRIGHTALAAGHRGVPGDESPRATGEGRAEAAGRAGPPLWPFHSGAGLVGRAGAGGRGAPGVPGRQSGRSGSCLSCRGADARTSRVRAQALVALARVLRRQHADTEALAAYDALEQMGDTVVAGQPAALLAYRARLRLHVDARDRARARAAADAFARALYAGRWRIDRVSFEDARDAIVAADGPVPPAVPLARTICVTFWEEWFGRAETARPASARRSGCADAGGLGR